MVDAYVSVSSSLVTQAQPYKFFVGMPGAGAAKCSNRSARHRLYVTVKGLLPALTTPIHHRATKRPGFHAFRASRPALAPPERERQWS